MNEMEAVETQCSINTTAKCYVKSKYLHNWGPRELWINMPDKKLQMICGITGKKKSYGLDQIRYTKDIKVNCVNLIVPNNRTYEIRNNSSLEFLLSEIDYYNQNKHFQAKNFQQRQTPVPVKINYNRQDKNKLQKTKSCNIDFSLQNIHKYDDNKYNNRQNMQIHRFIQQSIPVPQKINYFHLNNHKDHTCKVKPHNMPQIVKTIPKYLEPIQIKEQKKEQKQIKIQHYERVSQYIKSTDWRRDVKNGCLIFINQSKKNMIPQMISYTAKKALSSGQFSNINFPTFAMKPQSALQTYCRCLGAAPLVLNNVSQNQIERIKAFNVIILTLSIQLNDIQKSFNPLLGQTFQGQIAGNPVYGQQISTNPHISYFLLMGKNYKLYGYLQLKANVGLNDAVGVFHGQLTLQFNDGGIIKGIMPKGVMSGVLFGQTKFGPTGAVYSYDPVNRYVCSYDTKKGDLMTGQIGKLKQSSFNKFQGFLATKNDQKFKHIGQKQYQSINESVQVVWSDSISYGKKLYFCYSDKNNLPIKMTQIMQRTGQKLLPSDSSLRQDIKLRGENNLQQSQKQNDRLQKQQQRIKKLKKPKKLKNYHTLN